MAPPKNYARLVSKESRAIGKRVRGITTLSNQKRVKKKAELASKAHAVEAPTAPEASAVLPPERPWEDPNYIPPTIPYVEHNIPESDSDD